MKHRRESQNSHRRVRAAENQVKTLRLIVAGVSRAEIARQLGVSKKSVCIYLQKAMAELHEEKLMLAEQIYTIEEQRLEAALRAVFIRGTDPKNVSLNHLDRVVSISERLTVLGEKRIAAARGTAVVDAIPPEDADRIAALVAQEATEEEREAIRTGDAQTFAAVVARVKPLL